MMKSVFQRSFYSSKAPGCSRRFPLLSAYLTAYALHAAGLAVGGWLYRSLDEDQRRRWREEITGHGHIKAWVDIRTGNEVRECLGCGIGGESPVGGRYDVDWRPIGDGVETPDRFLERAIWFHRHHRGCRS